MKAYTPLFDKGFESTFANLFTNKEFSNKFKLDAIKLRDEISEQLVEIQPVVAEFQTQISSIQANATLAKDNAEEVKRFNEEGQKLSEEMLAKVQFEINVTNPIKLTAASKDIQLLTADELSLLMKLDIIVIS